MITRSRMRWAAVSFALIAFTALVLSAISPELTRKRPDTRESIVVAPRPGKDVSWRQIAGIGLPVSATAGPYCLSTTRASCFAHSSSGAAIAAAQLLVRTFPEAGVSTFEPTIEEQVVGPDASILAANVQMAWMRNISAAAIPLRHGWAAGYRLEGVDISRSAAVRVLLAEQTGFTEYAVRLVWSQGDWKLLAPHAGEWSAVARAVSQVAVQGYRSYSSLGIGAGGAV